LALDDGPTLGDPQTNWREELNARVTTFRKRRARLQPDADPGENMELAFEDPGKPEETLSMFRPREASVEADSGFDMEMGGPAFAKEEDKMSGDSRHAQDSSEEMQLDSAPEDTDEMSLGEPLEKSPPMEILVGSPTASVPEDDPNAEALFYAPLRNRFLAGVTDCLILVLGAALFGGIFWYSMTRFCDHSTLVPLNLGILGLVAVMIIFAYFAIFTAIASATPGLLWMGCEIRNLRGEHPTLSESLWRAFGVLVSMSALMVGFIWAYVDSESLTWHDRMSGTIITETHAATELDGLNVPG
jgi:uncharacterized RDD family membrane protein YckC